MNTFKYFAISLTISSFSTVQAAEGSPIPIILDTDIGSDIDDAFALGLILQCPELKLLAVTTTGQEAEDRAWMVCRFLSHAQKPLVPVAWGRGEQFSGKIKGQRQYRRHPGVLYNRTTKPVKESAVELLYQQLKAHPSTTILAIGPLTNIAKLLKQHPDCKPWIKRIVLMGGAVKVGYNGKPPVEAEWNIQCNPKAASVVFNSGVPLMVAPLDATNVILDNERRQRIFKACTPLTYQIQALYQLWEKSTPTLYDPVAVALCFTEQFCSTKKLHLTIDDKGVTKIGKGKPNAQVAMSIKDQQFLDFVVKRLTQGKAVLPRPLRNVSKVISDDNFPIRVHAIENYETNIERRWWLCGKVETKNVGSGKRSCRSVVTRDFDGKMGHKETAYSGVIFNPVPGPTMGKRPRLRFRYYLQGTDTLRVQLYSLSKGYHRYLTLQKLPQNRWQMATVDLTDMRRPDGSGGPLSENERIDDIQFYVDPRAEVIIDDIVLYEAAAKKTSRWFPKSVMFTGWFDTGKQGREWPGEFKLTDRDQGYFWRAAQSIKNKDGRPSLRVYLRGRRQLKSKMYLYFRYKLTGGNDMRIIFADRGKAFTGKQLLKLQKGKWAEIDIDCKKLINGSSVDQIDEIQFQIQETATLSIDDLLLYERR